MKFIYIEKTQDAPKVTTILGYRFELNGNAVEVDNERIAAKFSGMEHIGIVSIDRLPMVQQSLNSPEEKKISKEDDKEPFLSELTINATRSHVNNLVRSKRGEELADYVKRNGIKIKKEDKASIKNNPNYTKAILSKYVSKSLEAMIDELQASEETIDDNKEGDLKKKIDELISSKTYNELLSFAKAKKVEVENNKKDTLIKAITKFLKKTNS